MLNHTTVMGRLARDPELRRTGSGVAVASFTLASDRDFSGKDGGQKETDWIDCVAWRNTAEFVHSYFSKGRMAVVSGRLQTREYTDKNGSKRKATEVVVDNIYFGDSKPDGGNQGSNHGGYSAPAPGSYGAPAPAGNYGSAPAQNSYGGYGGGYAAPTGPSAFAMMDDNGGDLPF